jgi:hypothetical protein
LKIAFLFQRFAILDAIVTDEPADELALLAVPQEAADILAEGVRKAKQRRSGAALGQVILRLKDTNLEGDAFADAFCTALSTEMSSL